MSSELESRVDDLEIHVAHQADTVEALNSVVVQQQKTIDSLVSAVSKLREELLGLHDLLEDMPANEKPPHY
ncbi:SlyX family protein [Polycladidibacter hongkongensis]|uniref:SlyX family protein n=1 Tax=Polycladidibacter hongkongensis TaxID=1647556 RepID=UPI00082E7455|nr:SlyX family protein [Pseudovibrio hongkongensis]